MYSQISLKELITIITFNIIYLFQYKWVILLITFSFGFAGVFYVYTQEPKFTAQLTFVTDNDISSGSGGYASIASQFGFDLGGGHNSAFDGDNLIFLLKSRNLVDKTLMSIYDANRKLFIDEFIENHSLKRNWKSRADLININFNDYDSRVDLTRDSILNLISNEIIKNRLEIGKEDKKLDIIFIKFIDINPFFAKKFIEQLVANVIRFYTDYKTKKNISNVNILQHQVDSIRRELSGGIFDVAEINDLNINVLKQVLRSVGQKKQIEVQVDVVLYTELLKNLEISKLTLRKETPLIQIIDSPHLPLKNEKKGILLGALLFSFLGFIFSIIFFLIKKELKYIKN